jgi:hypothetical protein
VTFNEELSQTNSCQLIREGYQNGFGDFFSPEF